MSIDGITADIGSAQPILLARTGGFPRRRIASPCAKDIAEDWYLGLRGKSRAGELKAGKTFKQAAEQFLHEYEVITCRRPQSAIRGNRRTDASGSLASLFRQRLLSEITPGLVQDYRIHRMTSRTDKKTGEPKRPARSHASPGNRRLRQVLKTANRHGWLPYLPDLSAPYKTSGKITHRAWFSPEEYKRLYEATRERAKHPKKLRIGNECETTARLCSLHG